MADFRVSSLLLRMPPPATEARGRHDAHASSAITARFYLAKHADFRARGADAPDFLGATVLKIAAIV